MCSPVRPEQSPQVSPEQSPQVLVGTGFGSEVENYIAGRKPYPLEIFQWIKRWLPSGADVLDMACGCGKATVDLREHVTPHVTGFDIDKRMLEAARKISHERGFDDIPYVQGDAKTVVGSGEPGTFRPETFDGITTCAAIHWMLLADAADNLRALLKRPNGKLIIVGGRMGKEDLKEGGLHRKNECQDIVSGALKKEIKHDDLEGDEELKKHGFERLEAREFRVEQVFTFAQACSQAMSTGWYAELCDADKKRALPALLLDLETKFNDHTDVPLRINRTYRCYVYKVV